jgi:hypothetical protein
MRGIRIRKEELCADDMIVYLERLRTNEQKISTVKEFTKIHIKQKQRTYT